MSTVKEHFSVYHFSQSNPEGPDSDNVPALLRRVADSIDDLGAVEVQDVVVFSDFADDGEIQFSATVYYHLAEDPEDER
ncbi:hypothetical protein ACIQM4_19455 [Streptomyces sp. NPDC091272]|uniref:hypothetical protein n=1 Tax=Streptomyces sp. NPDC091272 TaxID=3365981 RepID=UPI0037FE1D13